MQKSIAQRVALGVVAGAAGTLALDAATYVDMTIRGRSSSNVPVQVAGTLVKSVGIDLGANSDPSPDARQQTEQSRQSGLGALMGYGIGVGLGVAYGLARPQMWGAKLLLAGAALGLAAMVASDVPATALKKTNPLTWGASGWLSDGVPHLAYGLATVLTFEALNRRLAHNTPQRRTLTLLRLPFIAALQARP